MSEQSLVQSQLSELIQTKNLAQLSVLILASGSFDSSSHDWMKYLVQIFAMLTDPEIEVPTFLRRAPIFAIFKTAIKIKLVQVQNASILSKNVEFLIRIVEAMFSAVTSRREIDKQMQKSFHTYIQKLLASVAEMDNCKNSLPEQKLKILQKVYPIPNGNSKSSAEFICPDLILWYELFLEIKNTIQFDYLHQNAAVEYLTRISVCMKLTKEPVIRWVFIHNMVKEGLKVYQAYGRNTHIENMCVKIALLGLTEVREYFCVFLQAENANDHNQNMFLIAVRFNIVFLCFCLVQNVNKSNHSWFKNAVSEMNKAATILLQRAQHESNKIGLKTTILQRLVKFQLQLQWVQFNAKHKQQQFQRQGSEHDGMSMQENGYLQANQNISTMQCFRTRTHIDISKVQKFEQLLQTEIDNYRKRQNAKLSDVVEMSSLVVWSVGLLNHNAHGFLKCVRKIWEPVEQLKLLTCLLTEYHLNSKALIVNTVQVCLKVLNQYLTAPESIKSPQDIQNVVSAAFPLLMCRKQSKVYLCSYCGAFQLGLLCPRCDQPCAEFMCCWEMANMSTKWQQFIKMWDYFSSQRAHSLQSAVWGRLAATVNMLLGC